MKFIRTMLLETSYEVGPKFDSCEVGPKFVRSWPEVRAKLARSSCEVGPKFVRSWPEVRAKLARSSCEVGPKFVRSGPEVRAKRARSSHEVLQRSSLRNVNILFAPTVHSNLYLLCPSTLPLLV